MGRLASVVLVLLVGCGGGGRAEPDGGLDGSMDAIAADSGGGPCMADPDCSDLIACTIDHCTGGACTHDPCVDCCPDGLVCVTGLGCRPAPEPCTTDAECMDSARCTLDRCRDGMFCEHLPQDELCAMGESCFPALGCIPSPPDSCTTDEECTRGLVCLGTWSCQPEFGCQFVAPLDCNDDDDCTADSCSEDEGGCVHSLPDVDGDGYGDLACGADDCDDTDPAVHPGAEELCDGHDNNCDDVVDEGCCTGGDPCTTSCGSMGTTACAPDGTVSCEPPAEVCNGEDDDCDGTADNGFDCVAGAVMSCMTGCGSTGMRTCDDTCTLGSCVPPTEVCNGTDDDCDSMIDEGFACRLGSSGSCPTTCGSTGTRDCLGDCTWDSCVPPAETCNGVDDDCDGTCDDGFTCCRGSTRDCSLLGFFAGTAVCRSTCGGYNTSACTNCGNGSIDSGEDCDGAALGGNDCTTVPGGFGSGTLRCTSGCAFDTSMCSLCGNGRVDPGEDCDGSDLDGNDCTTVPGGFTGGTLGCRSSCTFNTSMCTSWDPSGIYDFTPPAVYMCAFSLVDYNISSLTFTDTGTMLTVVGWRCDMHGPSARSTRSISVSCTKTGGCDERYTLTGSFTDDDHWTGTLTAEFIPSSLGACADCDNQRYPVAGTRR